MATKDEIRDVFERVRRLADDAGLLEGDDLRLCEGGSRQSGIPWSVVHTGSSRRVEWLPGDGVLGYHKPTVLERLEIAERLLKRFAGE